MSNKTRSEELRKMDVDGLNQEARSLLKEQFNLRMQNKVGQLANVNDLKRVRKDIARVKTIINEKGRSMDNGAEA